MLRKMFILCILVGMLVFAVGCISPAPPKPGRKVVKISVQPIYSLHVMSKKYSPLFKYLADESGYDLRVVSAMSYENYLPTLETNQVHIGIQNPLAYVTLAKTRGAYPLAKVVQLDGSVSYRGLVIARKGSSIHEIADLRGQTVAAASSSALGGFLAQAIVCRRHGVDVKNDLRIFLVDTQDAVINAVYQGKVTVGFVREDALPLAKDRIDLSKLDTIAYTEYYPTWCVAAFADTPSEVAQEIAKALLKLDPTKPEHQDILEAIGISGFQEAADSDYDVIRKEIHGFGLPH